MQRRSRRCCSRPKCSSRTAPKKGRPTSESRAHVMPEARRPLYTKSAMGFRLRLKLLVLLFVGVLAGSFVVAGYLLARSARLPGIPSAVRSESDDELLASAARRLGKHETE